MLTSKIAEHIPEDVRALIARLESRFPGRVWLVGGTARKIQQESTNTPKDIDIAVEGASLGAFLETKITSLSAVVDVFVVSSLAGYLSECPLSHQGIAIKMQDGTVLTTGEYSGEPNVRTGRVSVLRGGGES